MLKELIDLKKSGAKSIKIEFESEYYDDKSAYILAELVHRVDLDLCVKLGGLSSITDLHLCKKLCANQIVAPMIESPYGVEKFLYSVKQVYGKGYPQLYLNIETKTAFDNLDNIISACNKAITGFIVGRSDLKKSLNIENPDDDYILELCQNLSEISQMSGKELILGGKIEPKTLEFINKLPYLSFVETRKVVINHEFLNEEIIKQSLDFELKSLKAKEIIYREDKERIEFIENSLNS